MLPPVLCELPPSVLARVASSLSKEERARLRETSQGMRQGLNDGQVQPTASARIGLTLALGRDKTAAEPPTVDALERLFGWIQRESRPYVTVRVLVCLSAAEGAVWEKLGTLFRRMAQVEGAAECVTSVELDLQSAAELHGGAKMISKGGDERRLTVLERMAVPEEDWSRFTGVQRLTLTYTLQMETTTGRMALLESHMTRGAALGSGGIGVARATGAWHDSVFAFKSLLMRLRAVSGEIIAPPPSDTVGLMMGATSAATLDGGAAEGLLWGKQRLLVLPQSFSFGIGLEGLSVLRLGPYSEELHVLMPWTTLEEGLCRMVALRVFELRGLQAPLGQRVRLDRVLAGASATLERVVFECPILEEGERRAMMEEGVSLCNSAPRLVEFRLGYARQPVPVPANEVHWPLNRFPARIERLRVFQLMRSTMAEELTFGADV
jgi:hypothetical protein